MKNHVFLEHAYLARRLVKRHVLKTKISPYAPIPSRRHAWVKRLSKSIQLLHESIRVMSLILVFMHTRFSDTISLRTM